MTGGRLRGLIALALTVALVAALAGCGQSSGGRTPDLSRLPLVAGAQVVAQVKECDSGANAFCALELVIVDPRYKTPDDMLNAEHDRLRAAGWTGANADTGEQHAADSPGHNLRLTYATAAGELKGTGLGWTKRAQPIKLALSRAMLYQSAALSLMLEQGAS